MSKLQNPQINLRGLDLKVIPLIQAKLGGAKSTLNNQHPIIIYTKIKDGKTKKKKNRYKYLSIAC